MTEKNGFVVCIVNEERGPLKNIETWNRMKFDIQFCYTSNQSTR